MAAPIILSVLPHMDGDHTRLAAPCSDTSLHSSISSVADRAKALSPPQRTAVSYISGAEWETDCRADAPPLPVCVCVGDAAVVLVWCLDLFSWVRTKSEAAMKAGRVVEGMCGGGGGGGEGGVRVRWGGFVSHVINTTEQPRPEFR